MGWRSDVRIYAGILLSWIGLLIMSSAIILAASILIHISKLHSFASLLKALLNVVVGHVLFKAGRRISQDSAADRLSQDHRAPVLLLRAFSSDGQIAERSWLKQRSFFGWILGRASFEERLSEIMENLGPTVALGRKGEIIPTYGFAREYSEDRVWRQVLDKYLSLTAWVVVMLYDMTPNVAYEIQHVLLSRPQSKMLLVPPPVRERTHGWYEKLNATRQEIAALPAVRQNTAAIILDPKEGVICVEMGTDDSANAQLSAINRALIPRYLFA
jgi:hypothetical protein